jgi:oligopeptidase A
MENPLLAQSELPVFSSIIPETHVEPAVIQIIAQNRAELAALLSANTPFTWENLMQPQDDMSDRLAKVWSPVSHMHATVETESLRNVYNACLRLLTEYSTEFMQNTALFDAITSLAESAEYANYNPAQHKVIKNELRDFHLSGINLPPAEKARLADIQKQLSELCTQFSENVLDATQGWSLHVTDKNSLTGLTEETLKMAAETAHARGKEGWVFTLDFPSYSAVMKYLHNRELRWLMYEAYSTRASDQGPNAGKWDNAAIMRDILRLRHEYAIILGFPSFAELSLATKMAGSPQLVLDFLYDLVEKSKAAGAAEIQQLTDFARATDKLEKLEAWDAAYYTEKLRIEKYALSQEELKPYFPVDKVISGMFEVVKRLYGITIKEKAGVDVWHPQVRYFEIFNEDGKFRGSFYTDLFAREHKRDGAWMDECRLRRLNKDGTLQHPIAFLTCNFTRPIGDKPSLLTQDDVETLFHEFGHCLHHLMTQINYGPISGINGVEWDAVEFPSQIMEHWTWNKEVIALCSGHYATGEKLPDAIYNKMLATKNFQSAMQMLRQVEFSLFDFRIHLEYDAESPNQIQTILDEIRTQISLMPVPHFNRFQNTFSHIFSGGYAAGYYSYKWAEVLASDAFSKFEETGIFDRATGQSYLENILEKGGLRDPMENFIAFRGRKPTIDALLRHSGLAPGEKIK